jgi:transposase
MAGHAGATRTFFLNPFCLVITPFYIEELYRNKFFLTQKYVLEGLSARQISTQLGCSKSAVLEALANFDIEIRAANLPHGHPSQPRFGQRYQKKKLIKHKDEKRVIKVVSRLRQKGLSLREIARILNEMKISTKCRGKAWHPEMVRRILQSNS